MVQRARTTGFTTRSLVIALACLAPSAAGAQAVISASPDITIALGAANVVTKDDAVASDNQLGVVALENLGPGIPDSADVIGYADGGGSTRYFTLDTTASLSPGGITARPNDIVAWNGSAYSLIFNGSTAGIPTGVQIDALSTAKATNAFVLSFDTDVSLPGGINAADEDLVKYAGGTFSLVLDGSAVGMDRALDVDGAQDVGGGYLVSFDTSGTLGAITFADEDILRYVNGVWSMDFDASNVDADWTAADLDALQVPEPSVAAAAVVGAFAVAALGRRRR